MSKENLKTVELGYGERVVLRRLVQTERGDEITADVVDWFIRDLGLNEAEIEECREIGALNDLPLEMSPKTFTFSHWRERTVVKLLKSVAAAKQLGQEQRTLYHKFVTAPAPPAAEDAELAEEYAAMLAAKKTAEDEDTAEDPGNGTTPPQDNHAEAPYLVPVS